MDILRVNRKRYSWNSTTVSYDGIPLGSGLISLDYSQKRERGILFGSRKSGKNIGTTSGRYITAASFKLVTETADVLKKYLTIKGLGSIGDASFTLIVQIAEPVIGAIPQTIVLADCEVEEMKKSFAEGVDGLVDEFVLCGGLDITENGMTLASRIREL